MCSLYTTTLLGFYALAARASPINLPETPTLQLPSPLNRTSLNLALSADALVPSSTHTLGSFDIQCDGARYGDNPDIRDCEGARSIIDLDTEQRRFGERHTGFGDDVFPLPYLVMGDKANCYFEVINVGGGPTANASMSQIRNAAGALLMRCASSDPSRGGIIRNIGGDNKIAVTLNIYEPRVTCRGSFMSADSCGGILADMPTSRQPRIFGPQDSSFVEETLPQSITYGGEKCIAKLFSATGRTDVANWYDIWMAVEAVFAVCARNWKSGSFRGLGQDGSIFLTLGDP